MVRRAIVLAHRMVFEGGSELSPAAVAVLRRSLASLVKIGVHKVCVVDGEQAEMLARRLALHEFPALEVQVLANRCWRKATGAATLVARDFLAAEPGPCFILRGDRPLAPETLLALARTELGPGDAAVVIASPPDSDFSGEAKVALHSRNVAEVAEIGLDLDSFDAIFAGHALVRPSFVHALEGISNPALEDGLNRLAERGRLRALPGHIDWSWGVREPTRVEDKVAALLETKAHPRYTLLNPGPVNTTPAVKSSMVHHDVCHRDASFSELMVSLTGKLRRIFRATSEHTAVLITGSGTAAMECAISSTVPRDGKILVVDNGAFGERLVEIARLHEMKLVHLRYAWGDPVDAADVERAFDEHPDIAVVAMVHHETSVGLLNPVRDVGAICRRRDAIFIVDAVSSLGAEELDVVRDNIDVCYGSANKCLHAISGAGFLCVSPRVWPKIETVKPRSYYLNLRRYRHYVENLAQTPFTPAVSAYFALDTACTEFLSDGHKKRWAEYRRRNERMRRGLSELGMAPFTRSGKESHSVVTCCVPQGLTFQQLYDALKARGYIIYGCKEVLAEKFLQVANMGELDEVAIDQFLATLGEVIAELRQRTRLAPPALGPHPGRSAGVRRFIA